MCFRKKQIIHVEFPPNFAESYPRASSKRKPTVKASGWHREWGMSRCLMSGNITEQSDGYALQP
jgi:hypothetical protein